MGIFDEFGKVWVASSPLTDNFPSIKKAIDAGADTIVLKSVTSIAKDTKPKGQSMVLLHTAVDALTNKDTFAPFYIHSSSSDLDCEMITVKYSNELYEEIKKYSPSTKVIANLAPLNAKDFKLAFKLKGDAIEVSPRWFDMNLQRPLYIITTPDPEFDINAKSDPYWKQFADISKVIDKVMVESETYKKKNIEKEWVFREGMQNIFGHRPALIKISRQYLEIAAPNYEKMVCDGITFSDSMKGSSSTTLAGVTVQIFNQNSISGSPLTELTLAKMKYFQKYHPEIYASASGGILTPNTAKAAIEYGAGSVQLCSAIYFNGYKIIKEMAKAVN